MPKFTLQDEETGRTMVVEGPSEPTPDEMAELFANAPDRVPLPGGPVQPAQRVDAQGNELPPLQMDPGSIRSAAAPSVLKDIRQAAREGNFGPVAGALARAYGQPDDPSRTPTLYGKASRYVRDNVLDVIIGPTQREIDAKPALARRLENEQMRAPSQYIPRAPEAETTLGKVAAAAVNIPRDAAAGLIDFMATPRGLATLALPQMRAAAAPMSAEAAILSRINQANVGSFVPGLVEGSAQQFEAAARSAGAGDLQKTLEETGAAGVSGLFALGVGAATSRLGPERPQVNSAAQALEMELVQGRGTAEPGVIGPERQLTRPPIITPPPQPAPRPPRTMTEIEEFLRGLPPRPKGEVGRPKPEIRNPKQAPEPVPVDALPSAGRVVKEKPTVPETPAEAQVPVLQEIRNSNARTVERIRKLFPRAQLTREQARDLRNQAFPETKASEQPKPDRLDVLDRAENAMKARLDEIRREGRVNMGIDPELVSLWIGRGAVKAMKAGLAPERQRWNAEMLAEGGEGLRPHLEMLWNESMRAAKGEHPNIRISERGIKIIADEGFSSKMRDQIDPAFKPRTNAEDTAIADQLIQRSGGPQQAAQSWLRGQYLEEPGSVQTILAGRIQRQLALQEQMLRKAGREQEAEGIIEQQRELAQADIARATSVAQSLQAFNTHYANWSPAAWLKHFRQTTGELAAQRVKRATGKETKPDPVDIQRKAADAVADSLEGKQPELAQTIRERWGGGKEEGRSAKAETLEETLRKAGHRNPKQTARKISEFYEREVATWKRRHKIPEFDAATEREILRRASEIDALPPDSVQRRTKAIDLLHELQRRKGFEWWELPLDFWYANILSGPITHAVNVIGNLSNMALETGLMMARSPTSIPYVLEAFGRALPKGGREGLNVLRTGRDTAGRHGMKFQTPGHMESIKNPVASALLMPWKMVGRSLKAEDMAFFYPLQEMRAAVLANRAVAQKGVPLFGGKRGEAVREMLQWTKAARDRAEAQATTEGLKPQSDLWRRRVNELIENARPEELMQNAREYAFQGTFNNDPYGVLGAMTNLWNNLSHQLPAMRLIVPFTNIISNLTNSMLNWTPVGYYRAGRAHGWSMLIGREGNTGKIFGKELTDPMAKGDMVARATVGTLAMSAMAIAAGRNVYEEDPQFMLTATGPADFDQRNFLRQSGWIPYSVKIGDRYYSYGDKTWALPMSIVGNYLDAVRYRKLSEQDALNRALFAVSSSFNVILQSSWLQGLSSIFNQASRASTRNPIKGIPSQAWRTGSSVAVPNALKQMDKFFDPTHYSGDELDGILMREIPFARRKGRPDLNVFGEPVNVSPETRFTSKVTDDVLIKTLAGRRLWPSMPVSVWLEPEEMHRLIEVRGPLLRAELTANLPDLATLPQAEAEDLVQSISRRVTAEAKDITGLGEIEKLRRQAVEMRRK